MVDTSTNQNTVSVSVSKRKYHCTSCRRDLEEHEVDKKPLEVGSGRFTVFCKSCQIFLKMEEPATKPK